MRAKRELSRKQSHNRRMLYVAARAFLAAAAGSGVSLGGCCSMNGGSPRSLSPKRGPRSMRGVDRWGGSSGSSVHVPAAQPAPCGAHAHPVVDEAARGIAEVRAMFANLSKDARAQRGDYEGEAVHLVTRGDDSGSYREELLESEARAWGIHNRDAAPFEPPPPPPSRHRNPNQGGYFAAFKQVAAARYQVASDLEVPPAPQEQFSRAAATTRRASPTRHEPPTRRADGSREGRSRSPAAHRRSHSPEHTLALAESRLDTVSGRLGSALWGCVGPPYDDVGVCVAGCWNAGSSAEKCRGSHAGRPRVYASRKRTTRPPQGRCRRNDEAVITHASPTPTTSVQGPP